MHKVYVIYTGGTIGMRDDGQGLRPDPGLLQDLILETSLRQAKDMPQIVLKTFDPLIDSSQATVSFWNKIASEIYNNYDDYDGFVVLHGTDTLAYTGSALSFMFQNLSKTIILTGAQSSIASTINDARENFINAIYIAGQYRINEVCIYFNHKLLRANRTTKFSSEDCNAYLSANYPALASIDSSINLNSEYFIKEPLKDNPLILTELKDEDIRCIRVMPNINAKVMASLIEGAKAVILETYGDGNMLISQEMVNMLRTAHHSGVILINRSQCQNSSTRMYKYAIGMTLKSTGMISAGDQTIESILSKLLYLFTLQFSEQKIRSLVQTNLRGELTEKL